MILDIPIYELTLEDIDIDGMKAISIVKFPAIQTNFMKFSSEEVMLSKLDTDKRIVTGAALIPDKLIYRNNEAKGEFYVKFSAETIEELNQNFFKNFKQQTINLEHEIPVNNVTVIESWIVDNPEIDKAFQLGFEVPKGTWMISMKIDNDLVWDNIKAGELKGFSIEALLSNHIIENSIQLENQESINIIKDIETMVNEAVLEDYNLVINGIDEIIKEL